MTSAILALALSVAAQDAASNEALLTRIKAHMRDEFSHVPNYTCLETTDRFYRLPGRPGNTILPLDTVRLEIVFSDHQEWYSEPGDSSFYTTNPAQFINEGAIGNGAFGGFLNNILLSAGATISYRGEQRNDRRRSVRYDYSWPRSLGGFEIDVPEGRSNVGEQGSFWADPQSLDLVRISSHAVEVPAYLRVQAEEANVSYARTRIRDYNVLLAQEADTYMRKNTGEEKINHVEFTHCRAFTAQSAIRFPSDTKPPAHNSAQSADAMRPMETLPESLPVTLQLTTPITEKDAVGTLISAQVIGDVVGNNRVLMRRGSMVRGRVRRIERRSRGFWISLEFTEAEVDGPPFRFYADLRSIQGASSVQSVHVREFVLETSPASDAEDKITMPELPGVASFFIRGGRLSVPASLRMTWITRSLSQ